jgi:site-specific recombinase XerC
MRRKRSWKRGSERKGWKEWLFPGRPPTRPITRESIHRVCVRAGHAAGLTKPAHVRALRHAFASHLLENGANIRVTGINLIHAAGTCHAGGSEFEHVFKFLRSVPGAVPGTDRGGTSPIEGA